MKLTQQEQRLVYKIFFKEVSELETRMLKAHPRSNAYAYLKEALEDTDALWIKITTNPDH